MPKKKEVEVLDLVQTVSDVVARLEDICLSLEAGEFWAEANRLAVAQSKLKRLLESQ